jgi:cytochrome c peroxidase
MHPLTDRSLARTLLLAFTAACTPAPGIDAGTRDAGAPDAGIPDAGTSPPLCIDGGSAPYPPGPYALELLSTVPDLSFDGVALHDYYEPCAPSSRLLVIRSSGAWCGTCRWDVAHTADLMASDAGTRLLFLDLVIAGEDNAPATADDVARWRARIDAPGRVAADPTFTFGPLNFIHEALPFTVVVDTKTMTMRFASGNADFEFLEWRLRAELATLDGAPQPTGPFTVDHDGLPGRKAWEMLGDMRAPAAPAPDPTNAFADDSGAAALGAVLFSDAALSPSGTVACDTCHDPQKHFADGRATSQGVGVGDRNAPSVLFAAHARWQFWDGRADSLWMQALGPFENPLEFASSRLFVAHGVFDRHKVPYEAVFGPLPPLDDSARFPDAGMPGTPSWDAMAPADQQSATRVFVNAGKAIAAYERTLSGATNRLDAYLDGDAGALTAAEKTGLKAFFSIGCVQCHFGPRLTDDAFHVLRFPTGRLDGGVDRGRADGVPLLVASEFRSGGAYSDDPDAGSVLPLSAPSLVGAFKTPPLRGVADTAPYGHGGNLATLRDVAALYSTAGLPQNDPGAVGTTEPWVERFTGNHIDELVPFLQVLSAGP